MIFYFTQIDEINDPAVIEISAQATTWNSEELSLIIDPLVHIPLSRIGKLHIHLGCGMSPSGRTQVPWALLGTRKNGSPGAFLVP